MKVPTVEELRDNPEIVDAMIARARYERSQAMSEAFAVLLRAIRALVSPKPGVGKLITRMG